MVVTQIEGNVGGLVPLNFACYNMIIYLLFLGIFGLKIIFLSFNFNNQILSKSV